MPCGCAGELQISNCAPYANLEDVQRALNSLGTCCKSTIPNDLNPITNPMDAYLIAFPNGFEECQCEMLTITNLAGDKIWFSIDSGQTWIPLLDTGRCNGTVPSTVDPVLDPVLANATAFPDGIPVGCEQLWIEAIGGPTSIYYASMDGGVTYFRLSRESEQTASLYLRTTTNIMDAALNRLVPWQVEDMDTQSQWDPGAPTIINIPFNGIYAISTFINFSGNAPDSRKTVRLEVNGTALPAEAVSFLANTQVWIGLSSTRRLNAGDTVGIRVEASGTPTGGAIGPSRLNMELLRVL